MKTKMCPTCQTENPVMYRIQIKKGKEWIFVCPDCIKQHQQGPFYRYGGTWKGNKH